MRPGKARAATLPRLKCSGANLADAVTGAVVPRLKSLNVQAGSATAADYTFMAAKGFTHQRLVVFWDDLEPAQGSISSSYASSIAAAISNAAAAGMYTHFCFYYGPNGNHSPGWAGGSSTMSTYLNHGKTATQWLAQQYGADTSVLGFGLNEVTPDFSDTSNWVVSLFTQQQQMLTWMRVSAPAWIGIISTGYGASAPYANAPGSGHSPASSNQVFTTPAADIFAAQGGNVALVLHHYLRGVKSGPKDGRTSLGLVNNSNVVKGAATASPAYPPSGLSRTSCQASLKAYVAPHAAWCGSGWGNCPLFVEESGCTPVNGSIQFTSISEYAADFPAAINAWPHALWGQWDWRRTTANDEWASCNTAGSYGYGSDTWQTWTTTVLGTQ